MKDRSTPRTGSPARRVIAIIGGGFSGTAVAIGVLRRSPNVDVVLVDSTGRFARGVAHATHDPLHLLNVPAGRMSLDPDQPDAFVDWLRARDVEFNCNDYVARGTYGDYLHDALDVAERASVERGSTLRRVTATATDVIRSATGERVVLDDGEVVEAGDVVLALGAPRAPRLDVLPPDHAIHDEPWSNGALDPLDAPRGHVLLIGSGLTAVDAAMRLTADDPALRVTMASRNGMLPRAHVVTPPPPIDPPSWPTGPLELEFVVAAVCAHVDQAVAAGHDWRAAIDSLRPQLPDLWQRLGPAGQRDFLRDHVREWEVRRHRMAPPVAASISELRADGRLVVSAGAIASVERVGDQLRVELEGAGAEKPLFVDRIIGCIGPSSDPVADGPDVVGNLLAGGRAQLDALGLGLRADATGHLLDAAGTPSASVWLLGAMRRGELWESTAVPELRVQADRVANAVHAGLHD